MMFISYGFIYIPDSSTNSLSYAAELLTTNKLSELACLALYLMYEKKQGKKSFWYPFIRELDRQRGRGQLAVESPLLWSEAELAYLDGSPTRVGSVSRVSLMSEGCKTINGNLYYVFNILKLHATEICHSGN